VVRAAKLVIGETALLKGNVLFTGGKFKIEGSINGKLSGKLSSAVIDGRIIGGVDFQTNKLTVGDSAVVDGLLNPGQGAEVSVSPKAKVKLKKN